MIALDIFCDFFPHFTGPDRSVVRRPLREREVVGSNTGRHAKGVNNHTGSCLDKGYMLLGNQSGVWVQARESFAFSLLLKPYLKLSL